MPTAAATARRPRRRSPSVRAPSITTAGSRRSTAIRRARRASSVERRRIATAAIATHATPPSDAVSAVSSTPTANLRTDDARLRFIDAWIVARARAPATSARASSPPAAAASARPGRRARDPTTRACAPARRYVYSARVTQIVRRPTTRIATSFSDAAYVAPRPRNVERVSCATPPPASAVHATRTERTTA